MRPARAVVGPRNPDVSALDGARGRRRHAQCTAGRDAGGWVGEWAEGEGIMRACRFGACGGCTVWRTRAVRGGGGRGRACQNSIVASTARCPRVPVAHSARLVPCSASPHTQAAGLMRADEVFDRASHGCCRQPRGWRLPRVTCHGCARSLPRRARRARTRRSPAPIAASTAKTKAAFIASQLVYTLATLLLTPWQYHDRRAHLVCLAVWLVVATWNGASFYIEVRWRGRGCGRTFGQAPLSCVGDHVLSLVSHWRPRLRRYFHARIDSRLSTRSLRRTVRRVGRHGRRRKRRQQRWRIHERHQYQHHHIR